MRFAVSHSTAYRYSVPVTLDPHVFRMRPRCDGSQKLIDYQLMISPAPAGRSEYLDTEGNSVVQAWFTEPIEALHVASQFMLDTLRDNPYDFLLPPADQLILRPAEGAGGGVAGSAAVAGAPGVAAIAPAVAEFARGLARETGNQTMPFLDLLAGRLFRDWRYVIREYGGAMLPETTLDSGEGSCRDFAVLFCEACRAMSLSSRFVSGYEMSSAESTQPSMHAWSEVYIPGGGWRGYDPTHGAAVGASHVAVAAAVDPAQAAPVSGAYRGPATSSMHVTIQMQVAA